jgi:type VI secretion system secreted protein VgrG
MIQIPRIGQEVVVSHVEGDPDRPLITGMVYNDKNMPPYQLPDNKTQSGIKSRSTKQGQSDNYNELRFEDKKGEEEVYLHAEKNFTRIVENNDSLKVGFDKKDDGDQTIEIHNNQTLKVGNPQSKDGSQKTEIWKDRSTVLKMGNDSLELQMGNQTTKVDLGSISTEAMQSIELKVGANSIKIDQMGVTIQAMTINLMGELQTQIQGTMTQVSGAGMLQLQGGLLMIN